MRFERLKVFRQHDAAAELCHKIEERRRFCLSTWPMMACLETSFVQTELLGQEGKPQTDGVMGSFTL